MKKLNRLKKGIVQTLDKDKKITDKKLFEFFRAFEEPKKTSVELHNIYKKKYNLHDNITINSFYTTDLNTNEIYIDLNFAFNYMNDETYLYRDFARFFTFYYYPNYSQEIIKKGTTLQQFIENYEESLKKYKDFTCPIESYEIKDNVIKIKTKKIETIHYFDKIILYDIKSRLEELKKISMKNKQYRQVSDPEINVLFDTKYIFDLNLFSNVYHNIKDVPKVFFKGFFFNTGKKKVFVMFEECTIKEKEFLTYYFYESFIEEDVYTLDMIFVNIENFNEYDIYDIDYIIPKKIKSLFL